MVLIAAVAADIMTLVDGHANRVAAAAIALMGVWWLFCKVLELLRFVGAR